MGSKNVLWSACLSHMLFVVLTSSPDLEKMTIEEYINYINPPAVLKFKNEYGDSILCVKQEDQISLTHLKKNKRDGRLKANGVATPSLNNSAESPVKRCPEGTVSIMEVKHEQVKAAGSVASFLRRKKVTTGTAQNTQISSAIDPGLVQMFAKRIWRYSYGINSAQATLALWQPSVDYKEGVRSGGEVWLTVEGGKTEDELQAGWAIHGELCKPCRFWSSPLGTEVSTTDMGSGRFPQRGYTRAAYVANVKISTVMGGREKDCDVGYFVSNPICYNESTPDGYWEDDSSKIQFDDNGGPEFDNVFYYGGPGSDQPGFVHY